MDCPTDTNGALIYATAENGRRGIGVVQPQSGLDYPFVSPSNDIRYLVADFDLSVDDPAYYKKTATNFAPPFRIKYLYGLGCVENAVPPAFLTPAHAADIVVCDAENKIVFDSTIPETTYDERAWGNNYRIYRWQSAAGCCQIIAHTRWQENDDDQRHYNKYLVPANATLDTRAVYVIPKRLKSVRVSGDTGRSTGRITFQNGYNTEITASTTTTTNFLVNTNVTLNAVSGSGLGKYSSCGPDEDAPPTSQPITKINGISVTGGDFLLSATDCVWSRAPVVYAPGDTRGSRIPGSLEVGAGCQPCCECQDYVDLGLKINKYRSQYALIGARVEETKKIHEQNIERWLVQRGCGLQYPLRLSMVPQRCPYMDIAAMVCNPCPECVYVKELILEITPADGFNTTVQLVPGYTALFSAVSNGRPTAINTETTGNKTTFRIPFPIIKASDSAYVRFRVKFSLAREYAITGVLRATLTDNTPLLAGCADSETRQPAAISVTQSLYCDGFGNTNLP